MRHLGRRVGRPRHDQAADLAAAEPEEERVRHHQPRRRVGGVRELVAGADVADGEDARVARAQPVVDRDARGGRTRTPAASRPRPSTFGARPAATSSSSPAISSVRPATRTWITRSPLRASARTTVASCSSRTPSRSMARSHDPRRVGVLAGQDVGARVDERHRRAEARERLGQLAADRPRADDREARGQLGQREDRLVGEVAGRLEARDRRHRRPARRSR